MTLLTKYIQRFEENFTDAIKSEINSKKIEQKLIRAKVITMYELIFEREFEEVKANPVNFTHGKNSH